MFPSPNFLSVEQISLKEFSFRAHIVMLAPALAIILAVAAPIPLLAPKIKACFFDSALEAYGNSFPSRSMNSPKVPMPYLFALEPIEDCVDLY